MGCGDIPEAGRQVSAPHWLGNNKLVNLAGKERIILHGTCSPRASMPGFAVGISF